MRARRGWQISARAQSTARRTAATKARVLLLGPRKHEKLGAPLPDPAQYNTVLRGCSTRSPPSPRSVAAFVDLYDLPGQTENGLHLTEAGELELVEALLPKLGRAEHFGQFD